MLDPPRILLLSVGAITLLLGLALWALDLDKRANRAFAALMTFKGSVLALSQVPFIAPQAAAFTFAVMPYLLIPIVPIAMYFASVFPRRRTWLGRPGAGWCVVGVIGLLWALYLWRHGLFWTVTAAPPSHPALSAIHGELSYASFGPLSLLLWGSFPVFGLLALAFVMDYARTSDGPQRLSHFLVGTGFMVNALFDGVRQLAGLRSIIGDPAGYPFLPWGWAAAVLPSLSVVPALAALGYMAWHRFAHRTQERRMERRAYAVAAVAILAGGLPLVLPGESGFFDHPILVFVLALLRLALPLAVTYGLLRYSLFDIDIRVRKGIGYALMAFMFGAAYFLASETLEGHVADRYGNLGGLAAAGVLTLFAAPLMRMTQAVARIVMPGVQPPERSNASKLYAAQFAMLMEDGQLTSKERRCMDQLRERLGLTMQQAQTLEMRPATAA